MNEKLYEEYYAYFRDGGISELVKGLQDMEARGIDSCTLYTTTVKALLYMADELIEMKTTKVN